MSTILREHLEKEKRLSRVLFVLLFCGIVYIAAYNYLHPSAQLYEGYIRLEPESPRAKQYISFHLADDRSEHGFMVLIKEPAFHARIEGLLGKKVQLKAFLYKNEPADFDKIEIVEIIREL